jgi:hypothetical protein
MSINGYVRYLKDKILNINISPHDNAYYRTFDNDSYRVGDNTGTHTLFLVAKGANA